jgi:hypothetical protein
MLFFSGRGVQCPLLNYIPPGDLNSHLSSRLRQALRWGVPDGTRDPDGQLIHADYILAGAFTAVLDHMQWSNPVPTMLVSIEGFDPLERLGSNESNIFYINRF